MVARAPPPDAPLTPAGVQQKAYATSISDLELPKTSLVKLAKGSVSTCAGGPRELPSGFVGWRDSCGCSSLPLAMSCHIRRTHHTTANTCQRLLTRSDSRQCQDAAGRGPRAHAVVDPLHQLPEYVCSSHPTLSAATILRRRISAVKHGRLWGMLDLATATVRRQHPHRDAELPADSSGLAAVWVCPGRTSLAAPWTCSRSWRPHLL